MNNTTDIISAIPNIRLFNICHYILSLGIILSQKGLIKYEEQNQTVPVFNAFFQYLKETYATEAKVSLLQEMSNKSYSDMAFNMTYVNETYDHMINEGLFAYYGNMTGYLSSRNFEGNTSFTALKVIIFDDLSKNYINNVSCSLGNVNSNPNVDLSKVAIDYLFADYLWPVLRRTMEKNLENVEKRKVQIYRRMERQISDNDDDDDSDDSSDLDMYFPNFGEMAGVQEVRVEDLRPTMINASQFWSDYVNPSIQSEVRHGTVEPVETSALENDSDNSDSLSMYFPKLYEETNEELPASADENLFFAVEGNQFLTCGNDSCIQPQSGISTDATIESLILDNDSNLDFLNSIGENTEDLAAENLWPTFGQSNFNDWPFAGTSSSSHPKIRRIDTSTKRFPGSENEIGNNEDQFGNSERDFQDMTNVQNNHTLEYPSLEIDIDDIPGTSNQSVVSRLAQFLEARKNLNQLEQSTFSSGGDLANAQEGELDVKGLVHVQVDYAGRREPVYFIFRNMEIDKKSKRMQSIAKAAISISSNEYNNYTFEDSLKMLKGYILKLEEGEGPVPTYKKLAIDFCKNNLSAPEEYNVWKIPNHPFINDVLFQTDFYVPKIKNDLKVEFYFRKVKHESLISMIDIYNNSSLLQESLSLHDFLIIKNYLTNMTFFKHCNQAKRIIFALYRLALRECQQEWVEKDMDLFNMKYVDNAFKLHRTLFIGGNYTFDIFTQFSSDKILDESKVYKPQFRRHLPLSLEIKLDNSVGVVNMDNILNTNAGTYMNLLNTLNITYNAMTIINDYNVFILKLEDKRSKEEKMVDIIKRLHEIIETNPDLLKYYKSNPFL